MNYYFNKKSLKKEILIEDLIVVLFIFISVLASVIMIYIDVFYNEINIKNQILAKSITYQINEHSHEQIDLINSFSKKYESLLENREVPSSNLLTNLMESDSMFLQIQVLDINGVILDSSSPNGHDIGLNFSNQPYFKNLKEPGDFEFSNSFLSEQFNTFVAALSMKTQEYYYVVLLDLSHFNKHLDHLTQDNDIKYLILDRSVTIISSTNKELANTRTKYDFLKRKQSFWGNYELIKINDDYYITNKSTSNILGWQVIILNDYRTLTYPIKQLINISIFIASVLLIIYTYYKKRRLNRILKSIKELKNNFNYIAQGNYDIKTHSSTYIEFSDLSTHFSKSVDEIEMREEEIIALNNNLELLINVRTEELSQKNKELNNTLKELKDTQSMLIESEKLASFSKLLAGVSHEINTPVGVSITSTSYLQECVKKLSTDYNSGSLSKLQFEESLNEIKDLSDMILKNILRAGDLITSFKKASGDNFYDNLDTYNLYELTKNLTKSIKLNYGDKIFSVEIDIPVELFVLNYPSAMSQVLTNLINNSIIHGFNGRNKGCILIKAREINNLIKIEYSDDGSGIEKELQEKVFEPFFTTNRFGGGTGLGLSIIKNLVLTKLHGDISLESKVDSHTLFTITIPKALKAPTDI